jgi:uncharacterized protein
MDRTVETADQDPVLQVLDDPACRALLSATRLGRLGFTQDALPAIQPVAYVLEDDRVIISARSDSRFVAGTRGAVVAFEIDSYDPDDRTGWSVTVLGPSRLVTDPAEQAACDALAWPLRPSAPDRCYVAVRIGLLHGWRAVPVDRQAPRRSTSSPVSDSVSDRA